MPTTGRFQPDYRNIVDAARNKRAWRLPLYDHLVDYGIAETILGMPFAQMIAEGGHADKVEGYRRYCQFGMLYGYDAVPMEYCACTLVQHGAGLCGRAPAMIHNMKELEDFPWAELPARYAKAVDPHLRALAEALPRGMKAIGGVGNGIFEVAQDFVPLMDLPELMAEEPETFELLWSKIGDMFVELWSWLLKNHGNVFAVCRMGDDLGYRSSTMFSPADIRQHIIPHYARVVALVHAAGKPFLLHSCGCIFSVMDDLIGHAHIDAKHSNEDAIAPFEEWLARYNDRIAIFGGIDMDLLCRGDVADVREAVRHVCRLAERYRGMAIGCGNSIADYVRPENYLAMGETVRDAWKN